MKNDPYRQAFTLVEIMIVVAIIGLLAAIAIPSFLKARTESRITAVANDLRVFGDAFQTYCMIVGRFPPDTHNTIPPGMEDSIKQDAWDGYAMGGHFNWEGPTWGLGGGYTYAGIALFEPTAPIEEIRTLDEKIDDGNLATGTFRLMPNGRYTYLLEER
jgi:prepilin-type N-terminal cleavage/methylation domain-containing protein